MLNRFVTVCGSIQHNHEITLGKTVPMDVLVITICPTFTNGRAAQRGNNAAVALIDEDSTNLDQ